MKNCEKAILVFYVNVGDTNLSKGLERIHQADNYIKERFNKDKIVNDDSLVILTIPVRNQPSKIELLNSKYPKYEEILKDIKEEIKNINN